MPLVRCGLGAEYTRVVSRSAALLSLFALVFGDGRLARADPPPVAAPPAVVPPDPGTSNTAFIDAPVEVQVRGSASERSAASEISVGNTELALRPRLRAEEVLEAGPELFTVQPTGGAMAQEYRV